ncbi:MAG TPA: DUF2267 domain-containing protein [Polyangiaceae bacterium]|nr:DUF2267 domain-containing protein [Polyangiaceae bacterium]
MKQDEFIERVRRLLGAPEHDDLGRLVFAVLRALAERFGEDGRPALEVAFEYALAGIPEHVDDEPARPRAAFGARVCELTGLSHARGRELARAVCIALTESVPDDALEALVAHAPPSERPLFVSRSARGGATGGAPHQAARPNETMVADPPGQALAPSDDPPGERR